MSRAGEGVVRQAAVHCVECYEAWREGDDCPHEREVAAQRDDCCSYNHQLGERPEVPLEAPAWSERDRPVMVDACIAPVVRALWEAGHWTLGSCCGHGGRVQAWASLVLGPDERDYRCIRQVIASVDDRPFALLQWQLVEVDG